LAEPHGDCRLPRLEEAPKVVPNAVGDDVLPNAGTTGLLAVLPNIPPDGEALNALWPNAGAAGCEEAPNGEVDMGDCVWGCC
jgi:hypothetical protein